MSDYIWNNTYSLEFLSEDFYDLNISTKDNVYEIIKKRKDDNEIESLSINISNHICMFVQLIDNLLGKISYNNRAINNNLNYKKLSYVFNFIKNQLYNCDYSLFLRIYSIYHTYNHRKNGYLDVNNLYTFILDIINKIENLNENNFLILPGGFYLQKEKMLVKILYIIHKKNNLYSFSVLNNSIYGIQYHSFKVDEIDNLGILLRDVVLCIKNITKSYLTNSLFWLCLYRLYIFPNQDNVDILYQILLPYLNNSFLTNNWNLYNNKTIKIADHKETKDIGNYINKNFNNTYNEEYTYNFNIYDSTKNINKEQNSSNCMNSSYNLNDLHDFNSKNNICNFSNIDNFNAFDSLNNLKDFDNLNNLDCKEHTSNNYNIQNDINYFNSFDFNSVKDCYNDKKNDAFCNNIMGINNDKTMNGIQDNQKKKIKHEDNVYGGIYVNIYKNKFTSFSMSLYYCIIYMLKLMNIQEEDIEIFKIYIYYSIILKLCDDLLKIDYMEREKDEITNLKLDNNNNKGNVIKKQQSSNKNDTKYDLNKIDHVFFVFLDMIIRKFCVLFHLYFCKMKIGVYDINKIINNEILNEMMKKIIFVKYMYNKMELKLYSNLTLNTDIIKQRNYTNSIKFPIFIKYEEELYKNYRKIEIKKDINIPVTFYISKRIIESINDLYIILYQTNLITTILINQKSYIKHCYLLAFSFISHILINILPSTKHFIYLSKYQKLKRALQIGIFNEIYRLCNNIYFISCSIHENKQIIMYKIINCSILLFLYDFLLRIPCVDICSPFSIHYNGFTTKKKYFINKKKIKGNKYKKSYGKLIINEQGIYSDNCSHSNEKKNFTSNKLYCKTNHINEKVNSSTLHNDQILQDRINDSFKKLPKFSACDKEDSYSSLDELAHEPEEKIKLSGYCIDISVFECFSNFFLIINPKLNIMRSDIIEYFYKVNEQKITKNSQLFLFEKSNDINTSEIEILENISLDLGLDRKKNHIIEYYCGYNQLFRELVPEFYHLRDMVFLFKSFMCPYIEKLPPVKLYKYNDINLQFSYKNKLSISVFNKKIDICGYLCPPKNVKFNFFSFIYQFIQSHENKKDNYILTYSNPNMYTNTYIENELDVLYVNDLPFFHYSLNLRDVEILLQYLTVPYIRIPLILEFFCDKNRIKSFHCFDIQQLLLCILFEPYIFKNKYKVVQEDNYIPSKDRNIFATKYGLLINELIYSPKNILCSIYSYLDLLFSFDNDNCNSEKVIMIFIIMICTYVNSYIKLLVETNKEIRKNLVNIENILIKENLTPSAKYDHNTKNNKRGHDNKKRKKKLYFLNKLKKKLIKNELYCSDIVLLNLEKYYRNIKKKLENEVVDILLKYIKLSIQRNDITTSCIYHGCILLIYRDIKFKELNKNNVKNILSSIFFILTYYNFSAETNYSDLKYIYGLGSLFVNKNDNINKELIEKKKKKEQKKNVHNENDTFSSLIKTFSLCECDIFISIHKQRNMLLKYLEVNEIERNIIFEHTIHTCACVHDNNKNIYNKNLNNYNSNIFLNFQSNENIIRKWLPAHKFKHIGIYTIENINDDKRKIQTEDGDVYDELENNLNDSNCFTSTTSYSDDDGFTYTEEEEEEEEEKGTIDCTNLKIEKKPDCEEKREKKSSEIEEEKNCYIKNGSNITCTDEIKNDNKIFLHTNANINEEMENKKVSSSNILKNKKMKDIKKKKNSSDGIVSKIRRKLKKKKKHKYSIEYEDNNNQKDLKKSNPLHDTESINSNSMNLLNFPVFFKNNKNSFIREKKKKKMIDQKKIVF